MRSLAGLIYCRGELDQRAAHRSPDNFNLVPVNVAGRVPFVPGVPGHIKTFKKFNVAWSTIQGRPVETNPSIARYKSFPDLCEVIAGASFVLDAFIERCQFARPGRYLPATLLNLKLGTPCAVTWLAPAIRIAIPNSNGLIMKVSPKKAVFRSGGGSALPLFCLTKTPCLPAHGLFDQNPAKTGTNESIKITMRIEVDQPVGELE